MKLTIIGCSGSMSGPQSAASGYLLQAMGPVAPGASEKRQWSILFDMGPGVMGKLIDVLDPKLLDGIVISHCHADHMVDLIGMFVYRRWWPGGPIGPVTLLGPSNIKERLRGVGGDAPSEQYMDEFTFCTHNPDRPLTIGPFTINSYLVKHPVEAYGLRVVGPRNLDDKDKTQSVFSFSGDTDMCEGIVQAAQNSDLFLCEAAFQTGRDIVRGVHLDGDRAGKVAQLADTKQLVLTHLQPWTDKDKTLADAAVHYSGIVSLAYSGATYNF